MAEPIRAFGRVRARRVQNDNEQLQVQPEVYFYVQQNNGVRGVLCVNDERVAETEAPALKSRNERGQGGSGARYRKT